MDKIKKYAIGVMGVILLLFFGFTVTSLFENIDNSEIVVIQAPWSGEMRIIKQGGTCWQGYGKVTRYKKSYQYWFSKPVKGVPEGVNGPITMRFNDKAHGDLSGSIRVDMPMDDKSILAVHTKYGSQEAIENQLVAQSVNKSVYMTGPLMSSTESNAEKRPDLISFIEDQAAYGIYKTYTVNERQKDQIDSTQEKTVTVVKFRIGTNGLPLRQENSAVMEYKIRLYNLAITSLDYEKSVEDQITTQQKSIMAVQTAIANAKKAEQEKYTVEQQGMADAAKAKWEQEVKKAQAVTEAQQQLAVAELNKKTEEQNKLALILKGEGEASYKKAVTMANNNLELKLDAWKEERKYAWDAFSKFQGQIVPSYISGGASGGQNNAMDWMQVMGIKAMQDLNNMGDKK